MKFMTGNELRNAYLEFFKSKDHLVLPSYSLIPENDPTLLMIGAGMAPFKPFFTGKMKPPHTRISTSQKCVRTGDIENVGRTARHHTFFEMLGNFSFGDYFKVEAITWAWEFLTEKLELPIDKLWVTIHPTDDEAYKIWTEQIGVSPDRVVKLEDNFWEIGPGPCGPCSEIYIDLGEERGCGSPDCAIGCDCDRYLEIWNLVFTQFDRDEEGNYTPLEKKNIDTGAGLERIASVLQNKPSNFETDLVFPIIAYAAEQAKKEYGKDSKTDVSLKVIGDHARSMTIMISDGILPSNEGRGYVLRRIIRRAIRHGRLLGINDIFLAGAVDVVVKMFGDHYTVLKEKQDYIRKIIQQEEERFQATLAQGIEVLEKYIADLKAESKTVLDGELAFKLYDTFGFPWELTAEILEEQNMSLDKDVFDQKMEEQRTRARAARQENQRLAIPDLKGLQTENLSYNETATESKVVWMWTDGENVQEAHDGQEVGIILSETSFYAEGGGQIGDAGMIVGTTGNVVV
ncbi:MAG: alanine--tRNA ligase, partial [Selenomonadales bacterium]|nr:alanine--tRNA ligase [Selenomonadales bacterium]